MAFVVEKRGRVLLRQRPADVVNAQLWEFPNVEIGPNGFDIRAVAGRVLGKAPTDAIPFCVIRHSITRYRITLEAFSVTGSFAGGRNGMAGRWVERNKLDRLPFSSAHRKILARLQAEDSSH